MKFCMTHWGALKAAISERGLDSLVAKDGGQAAAQLAAQARDGVASANFDPLMAAHNAILLRVIDTGGIDVMMPNEDGSEKCPLCWAQQKHLAACGEPGCTWVVADNWIPGCADAMRDEAVRLGLLGSG